jgi:hypothetical protein
MNKVWEAKPQNIFLLKNVVESFFQSLEPDFTVTTLKIYFSKLGIIDLIKTG